MFLGTAEAMEFLPVSRTLAVNIRSNIPLYRSLPGRCEVLEHARPNPVITRSGEQYFARENLPERRGQSKATQMRELKRLGVHQCVLRAFVLCQ
jgi:hypothetical protein